MIENKVVKNTLALEKYLMIKKALDISYSSKTEKANEIKFPAP